MRRTFKAIALAVPALLTSCGLSGPQALQHLEAAERYTNHGQFVEAIAEYEQHINYRLGVKDRPEWENPYFYLLLIGDLHLRRDDPESALAEYLRAESAGVEEALVSDRIRSIARYHEERGEFGEAIAVLEKHRARDPIIFDTVLDRLARALVEREDARTREPESAAPTPPAS